MAAISAADIKIKYSTTTASAGNSLSGTSTGSLGKYIATNEIPTNINDLFDDVTLSESSALTVDYRCVFIHNSNALNTLENTVVYIYSEVANGADIALAVDNIAASLIGSSSAQAATIASENTAPTGVSAFSSPTVVGSGVVVGNIPPGYCRAIWIRRTPTGTSQTNDGVTIAVTGDTGSL